MTNPTKHLLSNLTQDTPSGAKLSITSTKKNAKNHTYTLGPTFFADLTTQEKKSIVSSYIPSPSPIKSNLKPLNRINTKIPNSIDWRDKGAVTVIKNQLQCGSSPMFGVIGTIEATHVVYEGAILTNLSTQQVVDCCQSTSDLLCYGCSGSNFDADFTYVINNGLEDDSDYPYTGVVGKCKYDEGKVVARISSFKTIQPGDEDETMRVLAENSPIACALDASNANFQYYISGVFQDNSCQADNVDHGMLLIGYGVDSASNLPYFILKNSWSVDWGEKGYMRIIRGKNMCGVAQMGNYPIVH